MSLTGNQHAIRWYPPAYDIRVESVPIPQIEHPDDAIIKIKLAGLCGSDLHIYRGTGGLTEPHTCGHEFVGEVVALGDSFQSGAPGRPDLYAKLNIGDTVVSPFTVSCGECHFCRVGFTCRCVESRLFGTPSTPGGQAQYIRVPRAGGTLYNLRGIMDVTGPIQDGGEYVKKLTDSSLLLLCDILPTGMFAAFQALNHPKTLPMLTSMTYPQSSSLKEFTLHGCALEPEDRALTFAVVGLGPVGLCACISLFDILASRSENFRIIAVDPVQARREKMQAIISTVVSKESWQKSVVVATVKESEDLAKSWTNGVGCDAVLEVVGNTSALTLAYNLVRPFGCISAVGVHNDHQIPFSGRQLYDKNVSFDFGRCPVRAMFPAALELLMRRQDVFGTIGGTSSLVEKIVGFDEAARAYEQFDKGECGKVLFDPWK